MAKSYKVISLKAPGGENQGKTVYTVVPVNYGTLTTEDAMKQISEESTVTAADVKAVLDRYAHFVVENLKKGYAIELLGFGRLYLRFVTKKAVLDAADANASLVKALLPGFRPSYKMINKVRVYDLAPDKITLERFGADSSKGDGGTDGE